jgi:hypothetical protein
MASANEILRCGSESSAMKKKRLYWSASRLDTSITAAISSPSCTLVRGLSQSARNKREINSTTPRSGDVGP